VHHVGSFVWYSCNIFIGVRIIKEMPGSVASGTLYITICLPHFFPSSSVSYTPYII